MSAFPPVIVIFGAALHDDGTPSEALRRRVAAALAIAGQLPAPIFLPTGGRPRHGRTEAEAMAALLRAAGVPDVSILRDDASPDTLASVRACRILLRGLPHGPVYVATDGFHLPRCRLLLRLAGIRTRAVPPPAPPTGAMRWFWRLRELPAIPYDAALLLLRR